MNTISKFSCYSVRFLFMIAHAFVNPVCINWVDQNKSEIRGKQREEKSVEYWNCLMVNNVIHRGTHLTLHLTRYQAS